MATITAELFWDLTLRKWTTTLGGTTETAPLTGLVQGDIVKFAVRFVQSGAAVALSGPVFTASGIKALNDFAGSYLIQLSAPVLSDTTLYTFTVTPLNSANLNTFLQTYKNTWCALEIYDSANGILTTPLELQITPGYSLSGTPTDNVAGVISVAAGKTVTFPNTLTFPSSAGTNGYKLTTDGATTLTWTADNAGTGDVVGPASATDNAIVRFDGTTGKLVQNSAATITDDGAITVVGVGAFIRTIGNDCSITTDGSNSNIIAGQGYVQTGTTFKLAGGPFGLTTTLSHAPTADRAIAFPDVDGTVAVATASATNTHALFATTTSGEPQYRAIASVDIATALATPGAIGGSTASTGAFTTLTSSDTTQSTTTATGAIQTLGGLGVAKNIYAGGVINIPTTTTTVGQILQNGTQFVHTYGTNCLFIGGAGNATLGSMSGTGFNMAIGKLALAGATTTSGNMALGCGSLQGLTTVALGYNNVAVGIQCMDALTSAYECVGVGVNCSRSNAINSATAIGYASQAPNFGVAIGHSAFSGGTGVACTIVGRGSANAGMTGDRNTVIGHQSGTTITNGTYNTLLGDTVQTGSPAATYRTVIGAGAVGTANNQVMLGRSADAVVVPGGLVTVPVAQTATTAAVSVAVTTTALTTTAPAQAITLANGTDGQIKIIAHIASSGGGTAVLTPDTSAADYNIITFTNVGETATLQYHTTGGWYILALRGAVAA